MKLQNTKEAVMIGTFGLAILASTLLTGCGKDFRNEQGPTGATGATGAQGPQGYGAGVLSQAIPGLCGSTDGVRITTFQDKNNNGVLDTGETIYAVTSVCNGSNGSNGTNGQNGTNGTSSTVSISTVALSCGAQGGYTMTVTNGAVSSSYPICNGAQGIQGAQGQQGLQGVAGLNGLNGANGTTVTPVKFCAADTTSQFPEYGLELDGHVFAVYWGSTPASNASQAFLAELTPGSYYSTGGNNCAFTLTTNNTIQ